MLIRSLSLVSGVCISIARLRISLVRCLSAYATVEDNPPYKSVKDIYYEYFTELDEALNSFSDSAEPIFSDAGIDLVYKNDVFSLEKIWKLLASSFRCSSI